MEELKHFSINVFSLLTTGNDIIKESWPLPAGVGVELYTRHRPVDLGLCVEVAVVQVADVLLHTGRYDEDVPGLKVAVLQTQHTLRREET